MDPFFAAADNGLRVAQLQHVLDMLFPIVRIPRRHVTWHSVLVRLRQTYLPRSNPLKLLCPSELR